MLADRHRPRRHHRSGKRARPRREVHPAVASEWSLHSMTAETSSVLRILDANANRAGEGLRVVEEYLRLALDDRHLTSVCKNLRHDLAAALAKIPVADRHAARETQQDVGTGISTASEF